MSAPIKIASLGCGRIVERGLIPGVKGTDEAVLHGVASERPGVAAKWAKQHGATKSYESYDAVLDDPDVDAVYIPCTGDLHHYWTLQAAAAGKHVLCEKPLARTVAEAEQMVAACNDAGVVLQEAFMWRHHPRSKRAKELIEGGAIGELRLICVSFSFNIDRSDWRMNPEKGGGAMWDVGCYGVNAARLFAGAEPDDIHAHAHWSESGVDMTMQIALMFPGDVLANIDCSFEAPLRNRVELVGDAGRIILPDAFLPAESCDLLLQRSADDDATTETVGFEPANQYAEQMTDFCDSIRAGELQPPAENGLANMRVLEQTLAIARSRRG